MNNRQQVTLDDSFLHLSGHVQRLVEKFWEKDFADYIFPAINEKRFAVLYSDQGSRLNTPDNVLIGSLMLRDFFGLISHSG